MSQFITMSNAIPTSINQLYCTGNFNVSSHKLYNVLDPTSPQDASTKNYVDTKFGLITVPTSINQLPCSSDYSMSSHKLINVSDPVN